MKLDIVVRTFNSVMYGAISSTVQSIKANTPVCHLIVIDRFSSDGTIEQILSVFPDAKVIRTYAMLGPATRMGFDACDTEIIAVVDDDVYLKPEWYPLMSSKMNERVCFASCNPFSSERQIHFFAALVRKECVGDWNPAGNLSAGENIDLQDFLLRRATEVPSEDANPAPPVKAKEHSPMPIPGFESIVIVKEPVIEFHAQNQSFRYYYRKGRWEGAGSSIRGLSFSRTLRANAVYAGSCVRRLRFFKSFGLFPFLVYMAGETVGWTFPERYADSTFRK